MVPQISQHTVVQARRVIMTLPTVHSDIQRVLHDLSRTRLSRCPLIWLLPHPSPLPSASCLSFLVFLCVAGLANWGGGGVGEDSEKA
jgi:hypothetical protein